MDIEDIVFSCLKCDGDIWFDDLHEDGGKIYCPHCSHDKFALYYAEEEG